MLCVMSLPCVALVLIAALAPLTLSRAILYSPTTWQFNTDNSTCNTPNDIHYKTSTVLHISPGHAPDITPHVCDVTVKLLDESSLGTYLEVNGAISCGNTVDIKGYCKSLDCDQHVLSCTSMQPVSLMWSKVNLLTLKYTITNITDQDEFEISLSHHYGDGAKTGKSVVGKIAKWALILIIVGAIVVVLCIVGIPLLICCGCKKRGSSHHSEPQTVRYVNPGTVYQPAPPGYYSQAGRY